MGKNSSSVEGDQPRRCYHSRLERETAWTVEFAAPGGEYHMLKKFRTRQGAVAFATRHHEMLPPRAEPVELLILTEIVMGGEYSTSKGRYRITEKPVKSAA